MMGDGTEAVAVGSSVVAAGVVVVVAAGVLVVPLGAEEVVVVEALVATVVAAVQVGGTMVCAVVVVAVACVEVSGTDAFGAAADVETALLLTFAVALRVTVIVKRAFIDTVRVREAGNIHAVPPHCCGDATHFSKGCSHVYDALITHEVVIALVLLAPSTA